MRWGGGADEGGGWVGGGGACGKGWDVQGAWFCVDLCGFWVRTGQIRWYEII